MFFRSFTIVLNVVTTDIFVQVHTNMLSLQFYVPFINIHAADADKKYYLFCDEVNLLTFSFLPKTFAGIN